MNITDVRVFPVDQDKLRAFVSIVLDGCFVIGDIKIISGSSGLFVSMPSKRRKDGTFRDIAHPLNSETRHAMEQRILERYRELMSGAGGDVDLQARPLESDGVGTDVFADPPATPEIRTPRDLDAPDASFK